MAIYKVIFHNIIRPVFLLLYHSLRQRTSRACTAGRKRPNNSRTAAERENAYEPIDRCINLLGDHGHPHGAGHAHQAHPQQDAGAVL